MQLKKWPKLSKQRRAKGQAKHPWSEKNAAANRLVRQPPASGSEARISLWLKDQPSGVSPTEVTRLVFRVCGKFQACLCSHWVQNRANGILPGLSFLAKISHKTELREAGTRYGRLLCSAHTLVSYTLWWYQLVRCRNASYIAYPVPLLLPAH